MTPEQLDACARRMPFGAATRFRALHQEASRLMVRAWELRREAWALYRPWGKRKAKMKGAR